VWAEVVVCVLEQELCIFLHVAFLQIVYDDDDDAKLHDVVDLKILHKVACNEDVQVPVSHFQIQRQDYLHNAVVEVEQDNSSHLDSQHKMQGMTDGDTLVSAVIRLAMAAYFSSPQVPIQFDHLEVFS